MLIWIIASCTLARALAEATSARPVRLWWFQFRSPGAAANASLVSSRQYGKESDRKLPKVENINVAVVVVIHVWQEPGLAHTQIERCREQAEVGDIDMFIAVRV